MHDDVSKSALSKVKFTLISSRARDGISPLCSRNYFDASSSQGFSCTDHTTQQIFSATKIPENAFFLVRRNLDLFRDEEREGIKHPLDLSGFRVLFAFFQPSIPALSCTARVFLRGRISVAARFPGLTSLLLSDECCGQKSVGTRVHRRFFSIFTHASHMVHDI